jgi:hypothetical protein
MKLHPSPPVAFGDLKKNVFPKGRTLPLKAGGEMLRILEINKTLIMRIAKPLFSLSYLLFSF